MAEEDVELTSPHKYTKSTATHGTVFTEHLLNTSRGPQTPERTRKIPTYPGRMEERKTIENSKRDRTCTPGGGLMEREFPYLGKPPYCWRDQL